MSYKEQGVVNGLCQRCGIRNPRAHVSDVCGCCEIIMARDAGEPFRWGVQGPGMVPAHFNKGIGKYVEDRDDLKRKVAETPNCELWD